MALDSNGYLKRPTQPGAEDGRLDHRRLHAAERARIVVQDAVGRLLGRPRV
jgi:hypothetical protein